MRLELKPVSQQRKQQGFRLKGFLFLSILMFLIFHSVILTLFITSENNHARQQKATPDIGFDTDYALPSQQLPLWIQNYLAWHQEKRANFPGAKILTDPNAPNLLIRVCLHQCGGLNDRLGQLPWDLYLANQTDRLLLMHWNDPVPLEHFLLPNELDWRVPNGTPGFLDPDSVRPSKTNIAYVKKQLKGLFDGYKEARPRPAFWTKELDQALYRAKFGEYKNEKILHHRILGHLNEDNLEGRLRDLGETDMIHYTRSFGNIFWMFFQPSLAIKNELASVYQDLNIQKKKYSAVHCRVRHPKGFPKGLNVLGKDPTGNADQTGLPWEGYARNFAVETATRALRCAQTLQQTPNEPIYLFSDSNDLVQFMTHEISNNNYTSSSANGPKHNITVDLRAQQVVRQLNLVSRRDLMQMENVHIDRQGNRDPPAYYATFVDLLLAIHARCVTFGIGFYAVFATKVSGTSCKLLYQEETWGGHDNKRLNTKQCIA